MRVENDIFQDLESFIKGTVFPKWLWTSFGFLFGRILKLSLNG